MDEGNEGEVDLDYSDSKGDKEVEEEELSIIKGDDSSYGSPIFDEERDLCHVQVT
jgi:hypothetical protein